jgi:Clostripain family
MRFLRSVVVALPVLLGTFASAAPTPFPDPSRVLLERTVTSPQARLETRQGGNPSWTILVYLHADHNLWGLALRDIVEMQQVGSRSGFNVVVQIDAPSPRFNGNKFPTFDGGVRALVRRAPGSVQNPNAALEIINRLEILERLPEVNSDDPRTLAEFINWGVRRYPAQRYGLVLWDHGGQWLGGFGGDASNGDESMSTLQIRQGIQAGMAQVGLRNWDFLGFDTCLMGGAELLFEFGDLTRLYIASPELDFGEGWAYTRTLEYLSSNPATDMTSFARAEVAALDEQQRGVEERAHAAYDPARIPELREAMDEFVNVVLQSGDRASLLNARSSVTEYAFDPETPNEPTLYVDLGQFAQLVARNTRDANVARAANALVSAVNRVVIAKSVGSRKTGALGLSAFLLNDPKIKLRDNIRRVYENELVMGQRSQWKNFLRFWEGQVVTTVQPLSVRVTETLNLRDPSDREPASISFAVNGNANRTYGELAQVQGRVDLKVYGHLYLQPASGNGQFTYDWDGRWYEIRGSSNTSDFFNGFFQQPGDPLLYANASYTPPNASQSSAVIVVADLRTNTVTQVLDNSGLSPRGTTLEPNGTLRFQFSVRDQVTDETTLELTGRFVTIPREGVSGLRLQRQRVPIGEYVLIFGARDVAGNLRTGFAPVEIR